MKVGTLLGIPLPNALNAAVWVLGIGDAYRAMGRLVKAKVYFVVLEGTWSSLPTQAELAGMPFARNLSGPHDGEPWKGVFWGALPADFVVGGTKSPTKAALAFMGPEGMSLFQNAEHLRDELYSRWRLEHDRAAVEEEWREADAVRARRAAERQASLTLPLMLREKPFKHWRSHWPAGVVRDARTIFSEGTKALIALDGGTKRQRASILKRIVTRFNDLYAREGCIETGEANEVIARVEQLAKLVGLSNEDEALTGHRDW